MTLPEALLLHAWELLATDPDDEILFKTKLRRAVSGAYYAAFHQSMEMQRDFLRQTFQKELTIEFKGGSVMQR